MNSLNKFSLTNQIFYNKSKSRAKTLLVSKINITDSIVDSNIRIALIQFKLNNLSSDYNSIISLLSKSTIIISSNPNPKLLLEQIVSIPGYICKYNFINKNLLECDIYFNNYFPNNLPLNNDVDLYLFVLFNRLIQSDLINRTDILYEIVQKNLDQQTLNKQTLVLSCGKILCHIPGFDYNNYKCKFHDINCLFIQGTRTKNISRSEIVNCILKKKIFFQFMCRGFWIKIESSDYDKLVRFKLELNGSERLNLSLEQIELLYDKKCIDNHVVFFLNLELGSNDWDLPKDIVSCQKIYSNSCNMSRLDNSKFIFEFESNSLNGEFITISSLYCNLLYVEKNCFSTVFNHKNV